MSDLSTTEPSLREREEERTRLEFRRVALELFDEHGLENVTVGDIAELLDRRLGPAAHASLPARVVALGDTGGGT